MSPSTTTHGISSTNSDVKLTVLAGGLTIGELTSTADDITLGAGNLTLNVTGNIRSKEHTSELQARGQLVGSRRVQNEEPDTNVATQAHSYFAPISCPHPSAPPFPYTTLFRSSPSTTTHGISSTNSDVKLTVLAGGLTIGELTSTADDITLGAGNLTLNVTGNI